MAANPTHQSNYSMNGRGALHASSSLPDGKSSIHNVQIQPAEMLTLQVTLEEAKVIRKIREGAWKQDPTAPVRLNDDSKDKEISGRPEWLPLPISELPSDGETVPWLWGGYIARGHKTSFTGLWKAGKTTVLTHLLKNLDGNATEFCGQPVIPSKVLVVSEESKRLWADRRNDLKLGDNTHLINLPFLGRPQLPEWSTFISCLAQLQTKHGYDLIVFDSMHNLWGVTDENKNAEVLSYLMPLNMLTEQGAAVLLLAHPSKGDSNEGRATRGGGAWGGFVDIILEMRRHNPESREDTRRVLTAYSRWEETIAELVIELDKEKGEYRVVGTKAEARAQDRLAVYGEILPKSDPGLTPEEVRGSWPEGGMPKPGEKTIKRDLDQAFEQGKVRRTGTGVKGDPFRYSLLDT